MGQYQFKIYGKHSQEILKNAKYICYIRNAMTRPFIVTDEIKFTRQQIKQQIKNLEKETEEKKRNKEFREAISETVKDLNENKTIQGYFVDTTADGLIIEGIPEIFLSTSIIHETLTKDLPFCIVNFIKKINRHDLLKQV